MTFVPLWGWEIDVVDGDGVGEPDSVGGLVEGDAVAVHVAGADGEDDDAAVAESDGAGGVDGGGEVDVVAFAFHEAVFADAVEEAVGGSVVEDFRRGDGIELQVDFDGVALAGADALAVVAKG